ncbi:MULTISPECIES: DUF2142 domain-containing protein [unclassified Nocardioides]|uniref:DUF2142 domain-containing protein n=1 Tax=unclassified Nocardioides TaxID=2615069 RepID=UPI00114DFA65|nr:MULTISPECIES: DUF2142 domain-containing protein [unclassified Nocardioides]TQK72243.1 putative membrane protein DUF2142 [Nocardioides sp. SLBN-35]WGY03545.1 DUF2142 domain-containing protein [Nocardioides sp. QY071]
MPRPGWGRFRTPRPHADRKRPALSTWVAFGAIACLLGIWSLATPLWSTPDAPSHEMAAYAIGHGDLTPEFSSDEAFGVNTNAVVHVPKGIVRSAQSAVCYFFHPETPASCIRAVGDSEKQVRYLTSAGRSFPVYYGLTGIASNFGDNLQSLYLQRAAAIGLCAWMLAWAVAGCLSLRRPAVAVTGVAVSFTPMLAYLGGAVNPNTFEIAAAYALVACSIAFYSHAADGSGEKWLRRAMVAAMILGSTRILGPAWLAVWAVALLIIYGRRAVTDVWKARSRLWLALPVLGVLANMAWLSRSGANNIREQPLFDLSFAERLDLSATQINQSLTQMIGAFGWLDTALPANLLISYMALLVVILALGWAGLRPRQIAAGGAVLLLSWLLPVLLQAWKWNLQGPVWQGRYMLPTIGMAPILLLCLAAQSPLSDAQWNTRTIHWTRIGALAGLGVLHLWAFATLMQRNVHGVGAPGGEHPTLPAWQPPLGQTTLTLALVATMAVIITLIARLSSQVPSPVADPPSLPSPQSPSD